MKYLSICFLFIIFSCKTETKNEAITENAIDKTVYQMWKNYTLANPEFKDSEMPESWFFHNNEKDANRLADLIVAKKKQAGSGLYLWYEEANADLPKTGTKHIITDFNGKAKAIIEIKKVDTIPFNKIFKNYAALDMGTDIEPLKKWKTAHWDFFETALKESNIKPTENMLVVCEWFDTIWTKI